MTQNEIIQNSGMREEKIIITAVDNEYKVSIYNYIASYYEKIIDICFSAGCNSMQFNQEHKTWGYSEEKGNITIDDFYLKYKETQRNKFGDDEEGKVAIAPKEIWSL